MKLVIGLFLIFLSAAVLMGGFILAVFHASLSLPEGLQIPFFVLTFLVTALLMFVFIVKLVNG